jgi:hypothetical protein
LHHQTNIGDKEMNMVEKEKDLIGFAHKVISFRMNVIKACKTKGIDVPTDEQISDYINDYGLHFEDFMADYTEHEGMFRCLRTPLEEFKDEIKAISWETPPTEDEIVAFFNQHGNNIGLFCNQRTISRMKPLERKIYLKTIEVLPTEGLAALWNLFIEESAHYGEDSHIYDLSNLEDSNFLSEHMDCEEIQCITNLAKNGIRFIQWFGLNDKSIQGRTDKNIKRIITAHWGEIFERIMLFPTCYQRLMGEQWGINYFDEIVWPIITKEIGIEICTETNEIKYCE